MVKSQDGFPNVAEEYLLGYSVHMLRKASLLIMLVVLSLSVLPADDGSMSSLLISDIPVTYGDAAFRERILEKTGGERDPIGLVLTGGSARAVAHLGVLEYLEENGIVPDFIVSNSMGSIIAAMYAAGYSPAEMRAIVSSGVVREWVSGRIDPNRYMDYYRQLGGTPSFLSVRVNLGNPAGERVQFPTNLISSTQVDLALTELFAPATAASDGDFNRLMVPFLCVASDMNHRRPVVIRSGNLSEAVRSSMSIPLVFKPMAIDSMLPSGFQTDGNRFDAAVRRRDFRQLPLETAR